MIRTRNLFVSFALAIALIASAAAQDATVNSITFRLSNPPQQIPAGSASLVGNPGPRTLYYWIVTRTAVGNSAPAGPLVITNAPVALSASASVNVSWQPVQGASSYDVLRTNTATPPSGACNCAVATAVATLSQSDQNDALNAYTVATLIPSSMAFTAQTDAGTATNQSRLSFSIGTTRVWSLDNSGNLTAAGYMDFPLIAAPANPSSGFVRLYGASGTGNLTCLTSAGAACISGGGSGTVSAGTANTFARYAANGSTVSSSQTTEDGSGNVTIPGTLGVNGAGGITAPKLTVSGSGAGGVYLGQGAQQSLVANQAGIFAPTSVTNYNTYIPGTAPTNPGTWLCTNAANQVTCAWSTFLPDPGSNGIVKRTALNTAGVAAASDVIALWSGTCNGTTYLRGDGSCQTPAGSSGYATIQQAGTPLTQRATVNFSGAGVTCTDDAGNTRTNCVITSGSGGIAVISGMGSTSTAALTTGTIWLSRDTTAFRTSGPTAAQRWRTPVTGSITRMDCQFSLQSGGGNASDSVTITLQINDVDTALTATCTDFSSSANNIACSGTNAGIAITKGNSYNWKMATPAWTGGTTPNGQTWQCSLAVSNPS